MPIRFQDKLQNEIVDILTVKPLTSTQVAKQVGHNYHTTRKAMRILHEEGRIRPIFTGNVRDIKYTVGEDSAPNTSILIIISKGKRINLFKMVGVKFANNSASDAIDSLPQKITILMMYAQRAHEGIDVSDSLARLHEELKKQKDDVENALNIFTQIVDNHRNWNPEVIKRYATDQNFDLDALMSIADTFMGEDD